MSKRYFLIPLILFMALQMGIIPTPSSVIISGSFFKTRQVSKGERLMVEKNEIDARFGGVRPPNWAL